MRPDEPLMLSRRVYQCENLFGEHSCARGGSRVSRAREAWQASSKGSAARWRCESCPAHVRQRRAALEGRALALTARRARFTAKWPRGVVVGASGARTTASTPRIIPRRAPTTDRAEANLHARPGLLAERIESSLSVMIAKANRCRGVDPRGARWRCVQGCSLSSADQKSLVGPIVNVSARVDPRSPCRPTEFTMAVFCSASNGNSPVVTRRPTRRSGQREAVIAEKSSSRECEFSTRYGQAFITSRADGSIVRKPCVAVSIITRKGEPCAPDGEGAEGPIPRAAESRHVATQNTGR